MCGSFFPDIEGVHQSMDELKPIVFRNLLCNEKSLSSDGIDGFVGFDFSETSVLVPRVAKATNEKPFHGIALQFESQRSVGRRSLLQFLEVAALRNQAFDNTAGDAAPFFADAVSQLRNARSIGAARAIDSLGRDGEARHNARKLTDEVEFRNVRGEAELRHEDEPAAVGAQKFIGMLRIFG